MKNVTRRDLLRLIGAGTAGSVIGGFDLEEAGPGPTPRPPRSGQADGPTLLLITGWATTNIGDVGHTPGTLRYLEEHIPEARVHCWMHAFNDEILTMLRRRFPHVNFVEGGDLDASGHASTPELQRAFDEADFVIQNSGMSYNRFWAPPDHWARASLKSDKQFGLYAQSFDGLREQDRDTIPELLSRLDFIYTRDTESLWSLRGNEVTTDILEFGPDGCFGVDVRDDVAARQFMDEHGLETEKFLTVILRTDKYEDLGPNDPLSDLPGGPEMWSEKLRAVMIDWVRRTGMPVAIVPEVKKEIEPAKKYLVDPLPEDVRSQVVHRKTFWNVDEAVSFYDRAHSLVAVEPHSCIMALSVGTPAIHFFTRHHGYKAWMFRDIGLPEWLISLDTEPADRVISALDRIRANYDLAQEKAERAMEFVHARSGEMMRDIRRIAMDV